MSAIQGGYQIDKYVPTTPKEKLFEAAKVGQLDAFKELCEQDVNLLHTKDTSDANLPIHVAAYFGHVDIIEYSLQRDETFLHEKNKFGHTPLHRAAMTNRIDAITFLISKGGDLDNKDVDGRTVLHLAIKMQCKNSCSELLKHEKLFKTKDNYGNSLLHTAAENGLQDLCEELIKKKGVKVSWVNENRENPLFSVLRKLKGNNAKIMVRCLYEWTPEEDKEKILTTKNSKDLTVVDVAKQYPNKEVVRYLKSELAKLDVDILSVHGNKKLDKVKLFVCGSAKVGKTTLIKSLKEEFTFLSTFNWGVAQKPTTGISIETCDLPRAGLFSVWDVAGQPEFYLMHSLFMDARNGVTLLVYKIAEQGQRGPDDVVAKIEKWLKFLKASIDPTHSSTQRPTIILVATHTDVANNREDAVQKASMVVQRLKGPFKDCLNILDEVVVIDARQSSDQGTEGMGLLRKTLKKQRNDLLEKQVTIPTACSDILDHLASCKYSFPVKKWNEFVKFVRDEIIPVIKEEELKKVTDYLQKTGEICVLNVPQIQIGRSKLMESCIVLSPQWLCSKIFGRLLAPDDFSCPVLEKKDRYSKDEIKGIFKDILNDDDDDGDELINMLKTLELCYEIKMDGQEKVVIPCKLDSDMPSDIWTVAVEALPKVVSYGRRISCQDISIDVFPNCFFPKVQTSLAMYLQKEGGNLILWRDGLKGSLEGVDFIIQMTSKSQSVHIVVQDTLDTVYRFQMTHQKRLDKCGHVLLRLTQHVNYIKEKTCPGTDTVLQYLSSKCLQTCTDPRDIKQAYSIEELLNSEKNHQGIVSKGETQDHVDQILITGSSQEVLERFEWESDVKWIPTNVLAAVAVKLDEKMCDGVDYGAFAAAVKLDQMCRSLQGNCESITISLLNHWSSKKNGKSTIGNMKDILLTKPIVEGLWKAREDVARELENIFPLSLIPTTMHIEMTS